MKHLFFLTLLGFALFACGQETPAKSKTNKPDNKALDEYAVAYFGSGCFWCVEAIYESVHGVVEVESGYSGGHVPNPTYEEVCTGTTGHAETVKVYYDTTKITYPELLQVFFNSHDPTTLNRQGPDAGTQYRSAIFYQTDDERRIAQAYIEQLLKDGVFPNITTEVTRFTAFYKAEEYHQDFECRNPNSSYIQHVSVPRLKQFQLKMPEMIKKDEKGTPH